MQPSSREIFIPVTFSKRKRFGRMVLNALPGFLLALSVVSYRPATIGLLLLNILCFIAGAAVVYFSVREYRKNGLIKSGSRKIPSMDTVAVFTGLLLIAQGAQSYNAFRGFQPAHLLFAAALIYMFKGAMLPDAGIKKGFTINEREIIYRKSIFKKYQPIPVKEIENIQQNRNHLLIEMKDGRSIDLILGAIEKSDQVADQVRQAVKDIRVFQG